MIALILCSCSTREQRTSVVDAIVDLGGCNGLLTNEGRGVVYPAHCGGSRTLGSDLYGRHFDLGPCAIHEEAMLTRGTDIAYCAINGPRLSRGVRPGSLLEKDDLRLAKKSGTSIALHVVTFVGIKNGEILLNAPPGSFCPGDSGSPVIRVTDEGEEVVAFASSRRRGEACDEPGEIRAIPIHTALDWIQREFEGGSSVQGYPVTPAPSRHPRPSPSRG